MRKNQKLVRAIVAVTPVATLAALAGTASATLKFYEPFPSSYTDGSLISPSSQGAWVRAGTSTTNPQINVVTGANLTNPFTQMPVSAGKGVQITGAGTNSGSTDRLPLGTAITSGTVYYSFLFRADALTGSNTTGDYFISLNNTATGSQTNNPTVVPAHIGARVDPTQSGMYDLGIFGSGEAITAANWSSALNLTDTHLVVASYTVGGTTSKLWIDPDPNSFGLSTAPAALITSTGSTAQNVGSLLLRQSIAPYMTIDELRLGTSWGDVTPTLSAYFDVNGAPAGAGIVASTTYSWENAAIWSTDSAGGSASAAWPGSAYTAVFSAATDGTAAYTVSLSSPETCNGLTVEEGSPTFTGSPLTVSNGVVSVGVTTVSPNATAQLDNNVNFGTNLLKQGPGALTINSTASYTGTTTISAGTLNIGTGGTTGSIPAASVITNNGAIVFNHSNNLAQGTDFDSTSAGMSGTGNLVQAGAGNLTLTAANTYSGVSKATAGTLTINHGLAVQNSIVQTGAGGAVTFDASLANQNVKVGGLSSVVNGTDTGVAYNGPDMNLTINSVATNSTAPTTYSGAITGATSITKQGSNPQTLAGANTYSGATSILVGSLGFQNKGAMSANSAITVSGKSDWTVDTTNFPGATANFTGGILTAHITTDGSGNTWTNATSGSGSVGELIGGSGPGANSITWNNGGSLGISVNTDPTDLGNAGAGIAYSGNIGNFNGSNNNVGLMKRGFGVLTLTGSNSFSGQLKLNDDGGTLRLTTQLANAGQSMVTPTVYIGGATGATDAVHTQPVGTTLKILTNNALPSNSLINFGSGVNSAKDFTQTTTFTSINGALRLHDADPDTSGNLPSGTSYNQTIAGISGLNGLVQVGGGALTIDVPSGKTYSWTGTLRTDSDGTWQGFGASGGQRTGVHGVVIKNGPGEQDFTQFDDHFGGEMIVNAGTVGIVDSVAFGGLGVGATSSQVTVNGGTLMNKTASSLNLRAPIFQIGGSFTWDVNGNSNSQLLGQSGSNPAQIILASDPTITVSTTVSGGTGVLIFLGQIDDGQTLLGGNTSHGFTKTGTNGLTLASHLNSYRGNTVVQGGALNLNTAVATTGEVACLGDQANPGTLVLAGGSLNFNGQLGTIWHSGITPGAYNNTRTNIENNAISVTGNSTIAYSSTTASLTDDMNFVFTTNSVNWTSGTLTFLHNATSQGAAYKPTFSGSGFNYAGPVTVSNGGGTRKTILTSSNTSGTQTWSGNITGDGSYSRLTGGNTLFAGQLVSLGGVSVANNSSIQLASSTNSDRVIKTATLTTGATSSQLDLTDNKLIVTTVGSVGAWNGTAYSGVTGQIASAYTAGTWSGSGIKTSTASAQSPTLTTSLGIAAAGSVGKTTFGGQAVAATDTLVMWTYNGDANLSGNVDADDYFQIDSNYNKVGNNAAKSWLNGDFDYNGVIDGDDYVLIDTGFAASQANPPIPSAPAGGVTAVPEPAGMTFLALAAATTLSRRRRRA